MNPTDARNLIIALNNISGYVPPMLMSQVMSNPICRVLEQVANHDASTAQTGAQQGEQTNNASTERPRPHVVS
jgi:hypothetical protein